MLDHIFRTNIFAYYQGNRYQQLAVYFDLFSLSMTTLVMDSHLRNCTYIYEHKKIRKNGNIFKVNYLHTLTGGTGNPRHVYSLNCFVAIYHIPQSLTQNGILVLRR